MGPITPVIAVFCEKNQDSKGVHRSLRVSELVVALVGVIVVALLAQLPAMAQNPSSAAKAPATAKAPPRMADGKPDLQGTWSNNTLTPLQRPKGLGAK